MKPFKFIALVLVLALGGYVLILLRDAGAFYQVRSQSFGQCTSIKTISGPEDMVQAPQSHLIWISSETRDYENLPQGKGDLFSYDLEKKSLQPMGLAAKLSFPFHPHGIDFYQDDEGSFLYVINHRSTEETSIEVFAVHGPALDHLRSLQSPDFTNGNDLSVVAKDHFYLTTDFDTTSHFRQKAQQYLRQGSGRFWEYQNGVAKILGDKYFYPNGNALSADKKKLYVVEMLGKKLHIFNRTGDQTSEERVLALPFAVDNITWWNNSLILGVHPKLLALKKQNEDRDSPAPAEIWQLSDLDEASPDLHLQKLYANTGKEMSSSSVGLMIDSKRLLVGSVFDDHILDCSK